MFFKKKIILSDDVVLVVGLGNPGQKYKRTRHNIGFMVLNQMAERFDRAFVKHKRHYKYCVISNFSREFVLIKPTTYMNRSGLAVSEALHFFNIKNPQLLVMHDDLNLPFDKLRLRAKGSDGGHKGLASIIYHLQTQEIPRLRIGVGAQFDREQMVEFVLSPFYQEEQKSLPALIERASDATLCFLENGIERAMNDYNQN